MKKNTEWHRLSAIKAMRESGTDEGGLDTRLASERLRAFGKNTVWDHGSPLTFLLRENLFSLLGFVLIAVAAVAVDVFSEDYSSVPLIAVAAAGLVLRAVSCIIAGAICSDFGERLIPEYTVKRNGEDARVRGDFLTVGDIVCLSAGECIPADGKLFPGSEIVVNEHYATGAKKPRSKRATGDAPVPAGVRAPIADDVLLAGSVVVSGKCKMIVLAVGDDCTVVRRRGKIRLTSHEDGARMARIRSNSNLLGTLSLLAAFFCVVVGIFDPLASDSLAGLFLIFFSFAISSFGEILPALRALGSAFAMKRAESRGAILRDIGALETAVKPDGVAVIGMHNIRSGVSYLREVFAGGELTRKGDAANELFSLLLATCKDSERRSKPIASAVSDFVGDAGSFDDFCVSVAHKYAVIDRCKQSPKEHALLFDMSDFLFTAVGPIESIIPNCTRVRVGDEEKKITAEVLSSVLAAASNATKGAQSIIAVAYRKSPYNSIKRLSVLDSDLTFLGFAAIDSPASESLPPLLTLLGSADVPFAVFCDGTGEDVNLLRRTGIIGERSDMLSDCSDFLSDKCGTYAVSSSDGNAALRMLASVSEKKCIITSDGANEIHLVSNGKHGMRVARVADNAEPVAGLLALLGEASSLKKRTDRAVKYLCASFALRFVYAASVLFSSPIVMPSVILLWGMIVDICVGAAIFVLPDGDISEKKRRRA